VPLRTGPLALLSLLPLFVGAIAGFALREPMPRPSPPVAPTGQPILADAAPPAALPVGARFAEGIELVAVMPMKADPELGADVRMVELDWRLSRKPTRELRIGVRYLPPSGPAVEADHELVSAWLNIRDVPVGRIVRDIMPMVARRDIAGGRLEVRVETRGGRRLAVVDAGRGRGDDEVQIDLPAGSASADGTQ
jgi:hypothetical protein